MIVLVGSAVCLSVPECEQRSVVHRMSAPGLTTAAQLRYFLQWFGEFSELQREDFLPVLAAARSGKADQLAASLATLSCQDKPISLFQCRIKLFNEWFPTWTEEEQDRLVKGASEIDAEFGEKLQSAMMNGDAINGDVSDTKHNIIQENEEANHEPVMELPEHAPEIDQVVNHESIPVEIAAAS